MHKSDCRDHCHQMSWILRKIMPQLGMMSYHKDRRATFKNNVSGQSVPSSEDWD